MSERIIASGDKKFNYRKFKEDPIEEMKRLKPDTEPAFLAMDLLKNQRNINYFVKKYVEYISTLSETGQSAQNIASNNINYYLS